MFFIKKGLLSLLSTTMQKAAEDLLYQALHLLQLRSDPKIDDLSYPQTVENPSLASSGVGSQESGLPFSLWVILLSLFVLHFFRQVYYYYTFLTSEAMSMLWPHLKFVKDILPSFIVSVFTGVRTINITFLNENVDANAGLKKLHCHPCRSNYHTFYTDLHGYKTNFVIATNTNDKVMAFRQVMMKFISDRLTSGLLQRTAAQGILQWAEKGTVDMIDITMFLERLVMLFLYDIDPAEVYTPEQRKERARVFFEGTRWVLYDSYRPMGSFYAVLFHNTGIDFDPIRRPVIKALTDLWDDVYDRQMEMIKQGKKCLLGEFMKDPIVSKCDLPFIKANTIGAIMGGQFLTSISNITGMLYSISQNNKPTRQNKANWILKLVSDWSPLISVLRTYSGFVMSIPSTGNAFELHRSFSLGQRQCPGKGMVLRAYTTVISLLSKYNITVEGLENTSIRSPLWPFANQELSFKISKLEVQPKQSEAKKEVKQLRFIRTMTLGKVSETLSSPIKVEEKVEETGEESEEPPKRRCRGPRNHTFIL